MYTYQHPWRYPRTTQHTRAKCTDSSENEANPIYLHRRVRNYTWSHKGLESKANESEILQLLSPSLMQEVLVFNYGTVLVTLPHFKGAPDVFLTSVAGLIRHGMYGPGDTISTQGAFDEPFYILTKGETVSYRHSLTNPGTIKTGHLNGKGYWNDRMLIFDSPADQYVSAATFAETFSMEGFGMREILPRYPSGYHKIRMIVLVKLWRLGFHKASVVHAFTRIEKQKALLRMVMKSKKKWKKMTSERAGQKLLGFKRRSKRHQDEITVTIAEKSAEQPTDADGVQHSIGSSSEPRLESQMPTYQESAGTVAGVEQRNKEEAPLFRESVESKEWGSVDLNARQPSDHTGNNLNR